MHFIIGKAFQLVITNHRIFCHRHWRAQAIPLSGDLWQYLAGRSPKLDI